MYGAVNLPHDCKCLDLVLAPDLCARDLPDQISISTTRESRISTQRSSGVSGGLRDQLTCGQSHSTSEFKIAVLYWHITLCQHSTTMQ